MSGTETMLDDARSARVIAAVDARRVELVELTQELVRARGELGHEAKAQAVVEARLSRIGCTVERIEPDGAAALVDPNAGYPPMSYAGRSSVIGRLGTGPGPGLHLSGHVDVVPVERPDAWSHDPWAGEVADGKLWGRGSGDMKAGIAAYLIGLEAAVETCGEPAGPLTFSSVIEEECGGNGMRSVLEMVPRTEALLVGEPTNLAIGYAGVGVIWFRLLARCSGAHAAFAGSHGPVDELCEAVAALRGLEAKLNAQCVDAVFFDASEHPYNLNLGVVRAGVWASSVPVAAELHGRLGFGRDITPTEAQELVRSTLTAACTGVEVHFDGFRAEAYASPLGGPLHRTLRLVHQFQSGVAPQPRAFTFTTDARQASGEALCFGPVAGNIHGTDEWVDLESVHSVARTIALCVSAWPSVPELCPPTPRPNPTWTTQHS